MLFSRTFMTIFAAAVLASPVFAASDDEMQIAANAATVTAPATTTAAQQTLVNLNKATAKDLMKVKGINAARARAIVAYRKKNGNFKSVDDIANVKAFKKMKPDALKKITDMLTVD